MVSYDNKKKDKILWFPTDYKKKEKIKIIKKGQDTVVSHRLERKGQITLVFKQKMISDILWDWQCFINYELKPSFLTTFFILCIIYSQC